MHGTSIASYSTDELTVKGFLTMRHSLLKIVAAISLAVPFMAHAESSINTGTGTPLTTAAKLDFKITVPKVIYLRVGTGANLAADATVNMIDFTVPAANIGDSTAVAASAAAGDLGNGSVTARVIGNNGTVTFSSATTGAMSNGAGDTISYGQIKTVAAANTTATTLAHPTLVDAAAGTSVTLSPVGKIVNQDAKWTFTYLNQNVVAPGTYGGTVANNGRVTYTASMP
jgi:hypothetical protein